MTGLAKLSLPLGADLSNQMRDRAEGASALSREAAPENSPSVSPGRGIVLEVSPGGAAGRSVRSAAPPGLEMAGIPDPGLRTCE